MKKIKVAVASVNQTPLDWTGNRKTILNAIQAAKSQGVKLLCLPELCITGYGCEDFFLSQAVQRKALEIVSEIALETRGIAVVLGLPVAIADGLYDSAALLVDGEIKGFVGKQFLAREGVHYEPRWFNAWPSGDVASKNLNNKSYPYGDLAFSFHGIGVGLEICEDAWVGEQRPAYSLLSRGVSIICNPSASHFAFGKINTRLSLILEASKKGLTYLYANLNGNEAGRMIYDGGSVIATGSDVKIIGPRLSFQDFTLSSSVIQVQDLCSPNAENVIGIEFDLTTNETESSSSNLSEWERSEWIKEEEFSRAVSLGLFDYLRKSRASGFVLSTSGGADSSAIACLCRLMIELASGEIGIKAVGEKLAKNFSDQTSTAEAVKSILTCAYQATENSSEITRRAAKEVVKAVGGEFYEFDVDKLVKHYIDIVSRSLNQDLSWEEHDLALQNIQARVRGPGIWLLANVKKALLLATSNRSEAAVGYTTMDGDTCGGLSPIAGIDKSCLRSWLKWLEVSGPIGCNPISALTLVNEQQPTAELRPKGLNQTDEADLMPYNVLDFIEDLAIGQRMAPVDVYNKLRLAYPETENQTALTWVERFYRLWSINQWKRERYAPCFHLDDKNLDPKTWCRFPILSGGFREEIAEMKSKGSVD